MTRRELIEHCLTYPDAVEDYPFDAPSDPGAWTAMRHIGTGRIFALIYERDGLCVNLKCEPMRSAFLRGVYSGVLPAYHMNKEHWNTVRLACDVPEEELFDMIDISYRLTAQKSKRK